jgi:AcrR family transcriptional regulator
MAQVAEKAGLSRQAVYLHFPGREALLAALQARQPLAPDIDTAPSARTALALLVAAQANADPGLAALNEMPDAAAARLVRCRAVALRFQAEGALAPQLSPDAAADLLWSLTGPRLWQELTAGRGWSADRYRTHVTYLATGAVTK